MCGAPWAGISARVVRPEPGREPERLARDAEVLVIPACAARRGRHHAALHVVEPADLFGVAVFPRCRAEMLGPGVGIALTFEADQNGGRGMRVRLRIAADFVLADPEVERIIRHVRLDAPIAGRAPVVERQLAVDRIGDEVRAAHREPAHGVGLDVGFLFVEILIRREAFAEYERVIENRSGVLERIDNDGPGRAGLQ